MNMTMNMTISEMNERRRELGYSYQRISELSGVPLSTVQKVLGNHTAHPRESTLQALRRVLTYDKGGEDALGPVYPTYQMGKSIYQDRELLRLIQNALERQKQEREEEEFAENVGQRDFGQSVHDSYVYGTGVKKSETEQNNTDRHNTKEKQHKENQNNSNQNKETDENEPTNSDGQPYYIDDGGFKEQFTVRDYYSLSEENRVELIHGVIYDMGSPRAIHQLIAAEIRDAINAFIRKNKGSCLPLIGPVDVQILKDETTMVIPDFLVVCDKDKVKKGRVYGAPDFILEVISKSSRRYDSITKLSLYVEAEVREYWIVDPFKKRVLVYTADEDYSPVIYTFADKIPVHIYEGKCVVDMAEIDAYIESTGMDV